MAERQAHGVLEEGYMDFAHTSPGYSTLGSMYNLPYAQKSAALRQLCRPEHMARRCEGMLFLSDRATVYTN